MCVAFYLGVSPVRSTRYRIPLWALLISGSVRWNIGSIHIISRPNVAKGGGKNEKNRLLLLRCFSALHGGVKLTIRKAKLTKQTEERDGSNMECVHMEPGRKKANKQTKAGVGSPKAEHTGGKSQACGSEEPICVETPLPMHRPQNMGQNWKKNRGKNSALCGNTCGYYLCGGRRMPQPLAPWCCFWLRKNSFKRSGDTSQERWREERDDQTFPAVHYFSTGFQTRVFVFHPPERI